MAYRRFEKRAGARWTCSDVAGRRGTRPPAPGRRLTARKRWPWPFRELAQRQGKAARAGI